jgi:enoyl-CoA hydratase
MTLQASAQTLPGLTFDRLTDRAVLTLDRPERRNAIDLDMVTGLHAVCDSLERDPAPLIITGGPEVFAAGADIAQLQQRGHLDALAGINSGVFDRFARLPLPTIAAVAGPAIGGGAELAYACDFRIATTTARFGNPEGQLGILAAAGACWRLPELVGEPLAKEVLLLGRVLDAEEALAARLVTEVVAAGQLIATAHTMVDRMLRSSVTALRLTKLALRLPREAHPVFDNVAQAVLFETPEKGRRMDAFLNRKRS